MQFSIKDCSCSLALPFSFLFLFKESHLNENSVGVFVVSGGKGAIGQRSNLRPIRDQLLA